MYLSINKIYYLFIVFLLLQCSQKEEKNSNSHETKVIPNEKVTLNLKEDKNESKPKTSQKNEKNTLAPPKPIQENSYLNTLHKIKIKQDSLREKLKTIRISKEGYYEILGNLLEEIIIKDILPYWYGTPWSFSGSTEFPKQNAVSCAYFTSAVLLHAGVNLERILLSQQAPYEELTTLGKENESFVVELIDWDCPTTTQTMHKALTKEGLYFLACGRTHVGFLWKNNNKIYMIHAGMTPKMAIIEQIEESQAFCDFRYFRVLPLSTNPIFLDKWWNKQFLKTKITQK